MSMQPTDCLRDILAKLQTTQDVKPKKHPAVILAEKIEVRLFAKNKLRQNKTIYPTDELWDLFRVLFINHFGPCEEARLKALKMLAEICPGTCSVDECAFFQELSCLSFAHDVL